MPGFDLHVHTTASDGIFTGREVIQLAVMAHIEGIAITDHDTIDGLADAEKAGTEFKFNVIPGIELSTQYKNIEIHILGYYLDYFQPWVREKLKWLQDARVNRVSRIVDKLRQLGYDLNKEEVFALAGKGSVGRPHVAYTLLKKGYISSVQEAFHKLIGRGCPAFVPRQKFSPTEAVAFILEAGGVPVMAHPGLSQADSLIQELADNGLRGIEVYHPDHGPEDEERYRRMAARIGLLITGGSDFHGSKEGSRFSLGSKTVTAREAELLKKQKNGGALKNENL